MVGLGWDVMSWCWALLCVNRGRVSQGAFAAGTHSSPALCEFSALSFPIFSWGEACSLTTCIGPLLASYSPRSESVVLRHGMCKGPCEDTAVCHREIPLHLGGWDIRLTSSHHAPSRSHHRPQPWSSVVYGDEAKSGTHCSWAHWWHLRTQRSGQHPTAHQNLSVGL